MISVDGRSSQPATVMRGEPLVGVRYPRLMEDNQSQLIYLRGRFKRDLSFRGRELA